MYCQTEDFLKAPLVAALACDPCLIAEDMGKSFAIALSTFAKSEEFLVNGKQIRMCH